MNLFSLKDYKDILRLKIKENLSIHGYKGRLAQAAGCQRAYLSQVLNSHVHLTPDHAIGLVLFWRMDQLERDYFLELLNLARAATPALRRLLEERLEFLRRSHESISGRLKKPKLDNLQWQSQYYSSWHYTAIHILITISKFRTVSSIGQRLRLADDVVYSALTLLESLKLVRKHKEQWEPIAFDLHLPKRSPLNSTNHMNWRMQAVQDAHRESSDGVHFTAIYSLSEEDLQILRTQVLRFVSESRELALRSKETELVAFTCDLFRV